MRPPHALQVLLERERERAAVTAPCCSASAVDHSFVEGKEERPHVTAVLSRDLALLDLIENSSQQEKSP